MPFRNVSRGFTLIELLVVIAIIGILSSVVLASLQEARARARYAQMVSQMRQVAQAIEMYETITGVYPTNASSNVKPAGLDTLSQWPTPPCPGWVYDWDGPPDHIASMRIKIIRNSAEASGLGYFIAPGTSGDIRSKADKKITCAE